MNRNMIETVMGGVVLAVAVFFFIFAYSSSDVRTVDGYEVIARFDRIDGLSPGADVRVSGVRVGQVVSQVLDPETYLAEVTMVVDESVRLPADTIATVASESLLGGRYMALDPGGAAEIIEPGGVIQYTQSTPGLEQLIGQVIYSLDDGGGGGNGGGNGGGGSDGDGGSGGGGGGCLIRRSAAGLCAALLIAGWGGPLSAQTSIVPEGQDPAGPQSIEDLLDGIAEEDAPPDWAEPGQPQRPTPDQDRAFAILRALDKMTARIETLSVPVGGEMAFGTLTVTVRACRSAAENAEHAAFLEIVDAPPWDDPGRAFAGWMFAEARTLNVMEHAVYDVWLERCAAEPERPPEDFGATVRFTLPDDPPPPLPVPTFRR